MSPKRPRAATALALLFTLTAPFGATAALAWPFGSPAPQPAPTATPNGGAQSAPTSSTPSQTAASAKHASAQERAAADRLDSLSRAAFWSREFDHDPTDPVAGVELAVALRLLGRYEEATATAGRVLVLHPDNQSALLENARGYIEMDKGFYALEPLKKAQAAAPRDWTVYMLEGVAHEQNEQPEDARTAYLQALELSPNNPAVLSNLALWYAKRGDTCQAEKLLRTASAQPTANARERQNLALVLGMEGRFTEAEQLMRQDLPPPITDNNLAYLKAEAATPRAPNAVGGNFCSRG
jgi:Flp pilus assembly protein TadD